MEIKFCPDCRRSLPLDLFHRNRRNADGLGFYCAECARRRMLESRRRRLGPPQTRNQQGPASVPDGHKWCPECDVVLPRSAFSPRSSQSTGVDPYCRPCFNAIKKADKIKNHGSSRNYHLRRRYGITEDTFDEMFSEQGGVCAICRTAPAVHVDHDHADGRVRGLLCFNCNGALGQFRDRVDLMLAAVLYLRRDPDEPLHPFGPSHVGLHLGPVDDPRPPGETYRAEWADDPVDLPEDAAA